MKYIVYIALLVLLAGCIRTQLSRETSVAADVPVQSPGVQGGEASGEYVSLPLGEVSAQIKKFNYETGGKSIRYLVVLGSDGVPRTAIDGCDSCGTERGYSQSGSDLVCNVCGQHFPIDELGKGNVIGGGCMPIYLPNTVKGGSVLIKKSDLESQKGRF
jgi:uncharacterized membrane protein